MPNPNNPGGFTVEDLSQYPPFLRNIIRTTPIDPPGRRGPQFNPRDVPVVPGSPAGQLMYDPRLGRGNEFLMAQRGTDSVPAELTPKESVLNRNASELIGRHVIRHANALGNHLASRGIDLASMNRQNPLAMLQQQPQAQGPPAMAMPAPPPQMLAQQAPSGPASPYGYQYGTSDVNPGFQPLPLGSMNTVDFGRMQPVDFSRMQPVDFSSMQPITSAGYGGMSNPLAQGNDDYYGNKLFGGGLIPHGHGQFGGGGGGRGMLMLQGGTSDVGAPPFGTPEYKQWLINKINSGATDYTYGPTSPGATPADMRQFKGTYTPHLTTGDIALPQQDARLFSPAERKQLGVTDTSWITTGQPTPRGSVERYSGYTSQYGPYASGYRSPNSDVRNPASLTGLPQQQYPTVPLVAGGTGSTTTPITATSSTDPNWKGNLIYDTSSELGKGIVKAAQAQQSKAQSAMEDARNAVPTSNPYLNQLVDDPLGPLKNAIAANLNPGTYQGYGG